MIISNIINDSFGLLSKQLRFYCWHFRRNLDHRQRQELVDLLYEQHFENLSNKIKSLNQSSITDCRQQIGKLLFEHCFTRNRRHQLIQLIKSNLVDINVRLDNYGRTLLHRSAYNLDLELVKILIEHGVNIRLRDYAGNTALHIAIQSYRNGAIIYGNGPGVVQNLTSIIKLLLEADKNLQNERYKIKRIKLNSDMNVADNQDHCFNSTDHSINRDNSSSSYHDHKNNNYITSSTIDIKHTANITNSSASNVNKPINKHFSINCSSQNRKDATNAVALGKSESIITFENKQSQVNIEQQQQQEYESTTATGNINPILLEDASSPLVDTKNAFGRTALHYCVLVVGEQHLAHFVQLLISFGADTDALDTRMKTPLYCLVKRPGVSAIRQKCQAIAHLLESGCDDLGLAVDTKSFFNDQLINKLGRNISISMLQSTSNLSNKSDTSTSAVEPIFTNQKFKRVPKLKHIARLKIIRLQDEKSKLKRQVIIKLPTIAPKSLNVYVNRKILDQTELF